MRKSLEIKTNKDVLIALRESSGYTVEEVAKKIDTTIEKVKATEEGNASFTLTQIKKLSNLYRRPLVSFFVDAIPTDAGLPDYRINREKKLTPDVFVSERRAYYLSQKLFELTKIKSKIPQFPDTLTPEKVACDFRRQLNIELIKSRSPSNILSEYKRNLEEKLLVAIIELPLKSDDVRGFSIFSDVCVIVLNEGDNASVKLFSLFHEVFHLLKRSSGICSMEIEQEGENIETKCNSFSAEFLVPLDDLKKECEKIMSFDERVISELSKKYGVSKQVIMLRLLKCGFIKKSLYDKFKKEKEKIRDEKELSGYRRNWKKVFLNRHSNLAIEKLKQAYYSNQISYSDLHDFCDMKSEYIGKLFFG